MQADKEANMGFINEPKRFNVAITRAKELLIVIGNANLLKVTTNVDRLTTDRSILARIPTGLPS